MYFCFKKNIQKSYYKEFGDEAETLHMHACVYIKCAFYCHCPTAFLHSCHRLIIEKGVLAICAVSLKKHVFDFPFHTNVYFIVLLCFI